MRQYFLLKIKVKNAFNVSKQTEEMYIIGTMILVEERKFEQMSCFLSGAYCKGSGDYRQRITCVIHKSLCDSYVFKW